MLLINDGKILTMAGDILDPGCDLIENGKIKAIDKNISASQNDIVMDAKGLWVMPRIIEAHCHIGITEEKKVQKEMIEL